MRRQRVVRHVNALGGQQRYILWLACEHKVSFSDRDIAAMPRADAEALMKASACDCPFCPDPPPENTQLTKSAAQLWKEAGEP